jgi:hypothetical protein
MGRRPRPDFARSRIAAALHALCIAGCSGNSAWRVSSGAPTPPPPPVGGSVSVYSTSAGFGAFLGMVLFGAATNYGSGLHALPMDPDRRVAEQDCTKPIEDPSANLRCR